jgi:dephospho-CoA kinase
MKRIIGLTGGIATGKTTVANYLAESFHLPILDADIYARDAVSPGSEILSAIAQRYGQDIFQSDNSLNRQKLGEIIFKERDERHWLEGLIHPYVQEKFIREIALSLAPVIVAVIPLLFEAGMTDLVTEIWVVSCSKEQQLARLMQRNNLTLEQAEVRIASQISLEEKITHADVVLDNSLTLELLLKQVDQALKIKTFD